MPSLPNENRFSVLSVDKMTEIDGPFENTKVVQPSGTTSVEMPKNRTYRPQWERRLPRHLVVEMLEEKRDALSLKLKVELEAMDTGDVVVSR